MTVATWRITQQAVAFASSKSMLDLFQTSSGTRVHRVYRMYLFNTQTNAVTGVITTMRITRLITSTPTGGTTVTPFAHDTNNSALSASTTAGTGRTVTESSTDIFREWIYSNDEPAVGTGTMDEWECFVPFAEIWNAGYGDPNVQPIVCRTTQGVHIKHQGSSAVGVADLEIEFTDEAN